jgi:LysM repeat protein
LKHFLFIILIIFHYPYLYSQTKRITRLEYIRLYSNIAIKEMKLTGIPASITLAQGCLESDDGNSTLAKEANNHFGIKCHKDWNGEIVYHDDNKKGECFRKYSNVNESYKDHSNFIKNSIRYTPLFQLNVTDYKSWAKGLKEAGYATNPKYAEMLIQIIEDNKLNELDNEVNSFRKKENKSKNKIIETIENAYNKNYINGYEVKTNNRVKYIIIKENDKIENVAKSLNMFKWELLKYNNLTKDSTLRNGQILYIQNKRNRAASGYEKHTVEKGETINSISQKYAVKIRKILKKNQLTPDYKVKTGDVLFLRKIQTQTN